MQHSYDLGDADEATNFLAVVRYDRAPGKRVHCEDFAQILGEMPEDKYGGVLRASAPQTYLTIASVLMGFETLGEVAVHELLRRLAVNEMLGNPDMHLKNIGLIYPDDSTPAFPPAYDIVAYSAFNSISGHALMILPPHLDAGTKRKTAAGAPRPKQALSPAIVRTSAAPWPSLKSPQPRPLPIVCAPRSRCGRR